FSESLEVTDVIVSGAPFGISGSVSGLIAAGGSDGVEVTLSTATAGAFTGTATAALESSGVGTSGIAANADLGTQAVNLQANVFQAATAQVSPTTIDLGVMRVGDAASTAAIEVSNVAPVAALNDVLRESNRTVGGSFDVSGTVGDLAAGESALLTASVSTASAGVFSAAADFDFISHNELMADISAGS